MATFLVTFGKVLAFFISASGHTERDHFPFENLHRFPRHFECGDNGFIAKLQEYVMRVHISSA